MGSNNSNIWGTTVVSIESVVQAYLETQAQADVFTGEELLALGEAAAVEYVEKQFEGPAMSDDEWASL